MTGNFKMQKQQVYFEDEASMYCSSLTVSYVITSAHGNVTNTVGTQTRERADGSCLTKWHSYFPATRRLGGEQ